MGIRSGGHLRWRGGIAYYRRVVPEDCRAAYGKSEENKSLETRSEAEAKRLEKRLDAAFDDDIRAIRTALDPQAVAATITGSMVVRGGGSLRGALGWTKAIADSPLRGETQKNAIDLVRDHLDRLHAHGADVDKLLKEFADILPPAPLPAEVWERCRTEMLATIRFQVARATSTAAPVPSPVPGFCAFRTIYDKWAAEQKPTAKTLYSWKKILGKLVAHVMDVEAVTEDELMAWNAASLTEDGVIGWKDALVAKRLDPTTIKNHLTILRTIYNYAGANKLVSTSVVEAVKGVRFKAKKRPGTKKLGYTDDEAITILTAARRERDPVLRWSPWVAAATGARIDEICGAMVADITMDVGLPWLHIRLDERQKDEEQDPEMKTENSERTVPIHKGLIREGFLDYVAGLPKDSPLFPDLTPDMFGRRGGNGSKRVGRWVRDKLKITDPRKQPSHAWRHRYRSICRNPRYGIGEDVTDYMSGHGGSGGEGRGYGEYRDAMVAAIHILPSPLPTPPS